MIWYRKRTKKGHKSDTKSKIKTMADIQRFRHEGTEDPSRDSLTINLSFSKYPIIEAIAKADFGFNVIKTHSSASQWDLFWCDRVSHPAHPSANTSKRFGTSKLSRSSTTFPGCTMSTEKISSQRT